MLAAMKAIRTNGVNFVVLDLAMQTEPSLCSPLEYIWRWDDIKGVELNERVEDEKDVWSDEISKNYWEEWKGEWVLKTCTRRVSRL